jgi:3-phenylpropionate/cinnamic acid dioxygenase small subunit
VHSTRSIENLIARYAELVDAGDFPGLGELFDGAVFGGSGDAVVRGREPVEKLFGAMVRVYEDGTPRTKHVTTNIRIELDDEAGTAVSHSYVTVFQALPDMALQPIVAGRYRDVFERRQGIWGFVERRFTTDLVGDVSRHLLVGPDVLSP